jgi:DNA polymerase
MLGEAPGFSENADGVPFVGQAGRLLDQIIERSIPESVRWCATNLVCCIPIDPTDWSKVEQPTVDQVDACATRLYEFVEIASPKLIICVGTVSRDWLDTKKKGYIRMPDMENGQPIPQEWILHPSYMLRRPVAESGMLVQQAVIRIRKSIEEYVFGIKDEE